MEEGQLDRRVRKTRAALRAALTELLQYKRAQDITVRELAERCDINRGTFYIHYKDVFDMVDQLEREMVEQFEVVLDAFTPNDSRQDPWHVFNSYFEFLDKNADIASALLGPNGDLTFVNQLKRMVRERCACAWRELYGASDEATFELCFSYVVSGCVGLSMSWLAREPREAPEQMAKLATRMVLGSSAVLEKQ